MSSLPTNPQPTKSPSSERGARRRRVAPALVCFAAGLAAAALCVRYCSPVAGWLSPKTGAAALPDAVRDRLRHLNEPVEIRFYAILPSGAAPESLRAFATRVDHLLSQFQNVSDRIRVVRNDSTSDRAEDAAAADGIRPFNLEKGSACFLGMAVVSGRQHDALPRLEPDWEPALPYDLAQAIVCVASAAAPPVTLPPEPISPEVTNAVQRLIPDIRNTSSEEGARVLREAAMQEMTAAGAEANRQIEQARQQLAEAENSGSQSEQQAAMKHVYEVQAAQADKIKAIAARLQSELDLFQRMKTAEAPGK